jgi:hypothetical protein
MSEEERRTSLASTAVAPITTEPIDQVLANGERPLGELQVGASEPLTLLEPDMIDNLAQPTTCNLVEMVKRSYRMEVGKGLVYSHQTLLDNVQIDTSAYVVVMVDMVHENVKNMKLKVPPDDTTVTLRDAITRRVQWRNATLRGALHHSLCLVLATASLGGT